MFGGPAGVCGGAGGDPVQIGGKQCIPRIYTLIYAFLTKRSHAKAAEALRKVAKDVVALKED